MVNKYYKKTKKNVGQKHMKDIKIFFMKKRKKALLSSSVFRRIQICCERKKDS